MKLVRLGILNFEDASDKWSKWGMQVSGIDTGTLRSWRKEKSLRSLMAAMLHLDQYPEVTNENLILIPDEARSRAEMAIETAANLISVMESCKRSISSPTPCVALLPETREDRDWLTQRRGIHLKKIATARLRFPFLDINVVQKLVGDRVDGVFLLAEAIASEHATGKFHELIRFFERAFARSGTHLVKPLFEVLKVADLGYNKQEIKEWVFDLRHPATHADRNRTFVLESDVRPVVGRMEQAAYDVLFNKKIWGDSSFDRREGVRLTSGTTSARSVDVFVVRGTSMQFEVRTLDAFGRYPRDLEGCVKNWPADWWYADPEAAKDQSGAVTVAAAGGQFSVREA